NAVQSNTISQSFMDVFNIPDWLIGLVLVILAGIVIFGGVKRIVKVTQLVVPIMATFYLIIALYIVITNLSEIPAVFTLIVEKDRKSTRLNSSHVSISYAVFCLKKNNK